MHSSNSQNALPMPKQIKMPLLDRILQDVTKLRFVINVAALNIILCDYV